MMEKAAEETGQRQNFCLHISSIFYNGGHEPVKTDIEIAQEAEKLPINEIGAKLGIGPDDLELYG